jgi:hypothetical protein
MLRSSSDVFLFNFPSSDVVFNLVFFTFQQLDFDSISSELLKSYSPIQNKNRPYDPSSLLRLFFILNLFNSEYDFYKSKRIDSVLPRDYLSLCGFSDQLPCYTTYFYFKQRFGFDLLLQYLNLFLVLFLNSIILFFKDELNDSNGLVISADSKPIAAYGNIPLGIIHSYNKTLNGKYGFKVFWLAVVYPFYFPFYFSFDKASAHDNPMLLNSFQYLKLLHSKTNIFFAADKGFDALDTLYNLISVGLIPFIRTKKSHLKDHFYLQNGRIFCKVSRKRLLSDGYEYSKHRHKFVCHDRTTSCPKDCSGIFWMKFSPELSLFRLSFQTNPSFKQFYKFRPRIETLNSSLTRWFNLKNVFYFPNIYTYDRFNLRLIAKAISHYTFESNASFSKRLNGETHDKKRICLNSRFTFQRS